MTLIALLIGVVLVVAALRNTQGDLSTALVKDVPDFVTWAAAILAIGALGWVPGLKPISKALLILVFVVIILKNYKAIISGFQGVATGGTAGSPVPTSTGGTSSSNIASIFNDFGSAFGSSAAPSSNKISSTLSTLPVTQDT